MVRTTRIAAALGATLVLLASACGRTENPLAPEARAMRNGGGVIVGGNATGGSAGGEITTQTSSPRVAEPDSTNRGGGVIVGGN